MLERIWIESFLLIDHLEMTWESGLHVLTGETGAGKSMVLEAIACLAGQRADSKWVRSGKACAEVGAVFSAPYPAEVESWLAEQGFDPKEDVWCRRTIDTQGKSKAWINQKPMPLSALKNCIGALVEIGHQHMHLQWLKSEAQREWLDALGGLQPYAIDVEQAWSELQKASNDLIQAKAGIVQRQYEREALAQRREDIKGLQPTQSAWEDMNRLHTRISGAADRQERMSLVRSAIYESRDSILSKLHGLTQQLAPILDSSASAKSAQELLEQARISLQEAADTLRDDREESSDVNLPELDAKLSKWHRTSRRYHIAPSELYDYWLKIEERWVELESMDSIEIFEARLNNAYKKYQENASVLTKARYQAVEKAEAEIAPWLPRLNLPDAKLSFVLKTLAEPAKHGAESIVMMFQSHPSLAPTPLSESASGGELARIALILALVQHPGITPPVRFFDEVDTGISGSTVAEVGRLLQQHTYRDQIVCISHQPQMAACADFHWKIEKNTENPPVTRIHALTEEARRNEIARLMAGGNHDLESAKLHAQQLRQSLARSKTA
ncbi:MAG: hypothetical protein V4525_12005 [Pseudomonadota bacterium]